MSLPASGRGGDTAPGDDLHFLTAYTAHAQAGDAQAAPPTMLPRRNPTGRSRTTPMARRGSRWISRRGPSRPSPPPSGSPPLNAELEQAGRGGMTRRR
jgi:hypothetical protein